MSIPISDVQNFIDQSFLPEKDKVALRLQLEKEGASESFFEALDEKCSEELQRRADMQDALSREIDARSDELERGYMEEMEKLDASIAHGADMEQYYVQVRASQLTYMRRLKQVYADILARLKSDSNEAE